MNLFNIFRNVMTINTIIIFSEETASVYELIFKVILLITCIIITVFALLSGQTQKIQWRYDKIEIDTHKRKLCRNNNTEKEKTNILFFFFVLSFL